MKNNTLDIGGFKAIIDYDPDIDMFRGEFIGLNGGADFYASDIKGLRKEGATSLKVFLQACDQRGIEPRKEFSGKFNVRIPPELHQQAVENAAASGKSLNQWVGDVLNEAARSEPQSVRPSGWRTNEERD